jgi:fibronectin-binding autotransporter adhesin
VKENWTVTPQAQLVYAAVDIDDFAGPAGEAVSLSDGNSLIGRLGIALDREASWNDDGKLRRSHVYGIGNLHYEFLDGTIMTVSGTDLFNEQDGLWGELGFGGSYNWDDDKYSIYGEGSVMTSLANFGDSYALKGTAGFRVKW